jgi:ribose transport system ATP-binding protein
MSGCSSDGATAASVPILAARGLSKSFPGVRALSEVDFDVLPGEVHVLVGENGAGKSTLVKILSGLYRADAGELLLGGERATFSSPTDALAAGLATVHQEFNLCTNRTVAENVFLGREPMRAGFVDRRRRAHETGELMRQLDVEVDPNARVRELGVAQHQMVEILKALAIGQFRALIMDEPTAALSRHEIAVLFRVIRSLCERGVGVVYISHRLEEIAQVGDRVTVFRDGRRVATERVADIDADRIIELMVGRPVTQMFPDRRASPSEVALEVADLTLRSGRAREVSFSVRRGEVLGLFGLVGAGRTETLRAVLGAERRESGSISVSGRPRRVSSPGRGLALGLGLAPEDRKREGIFPFLSVAENIGAASLGKLRRGPFLSPRTVREAALHYVDAMRIATPDVRLRIRSLSGGNQQKCILARLLAADTEVLLLDEPTRGIDVGAKAAIYQLINGLAADGKAVVMVSSDLTEVIGMCDRVLVFRKGQIAAEFRRGELSEQAIMRAALPASLEAEGVA